MQARFKAKNFIDTITNVVEYSQGFIEESKRNSTKLAKGVADLSVDVFYDYLDGLARSHPGMLHHVYEWGQVGNPAARLFELQAIVNSKSVLINAEFLESETLSDTSTQPFYDKAIIMEEGIPVTIKEKDAQALFFIDGGEEFFRVGPIVIANPGGAQTRGSFVKAFNEFYGTYFENVYLRSIRFYDHFRDAKEYKNNIRLAARNKNAYGLGRRVGLSWIQKAPTQNGI